METDAFFCQLLKQLPETFFKLLGLPVQLSQRSRLATVRRLAKRSSQS